MLWRLARILHLSLDSLLFPAPAENNPERAHAEALLRQCDEKQLRVVTATLEALLRP